MIFVCGTLSIKSREEEYVYIHISPNLKSPISRARKNNAEVDPCSKTTLPHSSSLFSHIALPIPFSALLCSIVESRRKEGPQEANSSRNLAYSEGIRTSHCAGEGKKEKKHLASIPSRP